MLSLNKTENSKYMSEELSDFLNDSQFLNDMPKNKKSKKRINVEKEFHELSEIKPTSSKKKKVIEDFDACGESRQKTLNVMTRQLEVRKQIDENLFKSLSEVIANFEVDANVIEENQKKLDHLTGCFNKCMQQTTAAHKNKLEAFKSVHATFKMEAEGLLMRGATKPDDRPLWFDVYKAFPPTTEPKFARPKPDNAPIRQIFYKEDTIRAKFHAKGYGLNVNMLSLSGETQIKKLVQNYQKLQSEGLPEGDILQKTVETVSSARQVETPKDTSKNPDSVTNKIFVEQDFKNIFKE